MLYLSQILNSKVVDSSGAKVGKVKEVLIEQKTGVYSPLRYLLVKGRKGSLYIPYEYVEHLHDKEAGLSVLVSKLSGEEPDLKDYIFLDRHVLDQQIVDVGGARVVRVNDLRLGNFEDKMCVLGIDVSTKGLLRRLGLERLDFFNVLQVKFIDWRKAQTVRGNQLKVDTISKDLIRLHPADLANIIEDLNLKQGSKLVDRLDAKMAAKVLEEVDPRMQKILVKYLGPEKVAGIFEQMPADDIVNLLKTMPKEEAKAFLALLKNGKTGKIEKLIKYEDDTAGGMMTVDFIKMRPNWTVEEATEEIKKRSPALHSILYTYVLDNDDRFVGAVSLRWIIISDPKKKLKDLLKTFPMTSVLRPDQDIEEVMKVMTKYDLYTAVVLDDDNRMLGVVTIDDVMRHLVPKA